MCKQNNNGFYELCRSDYKYSFCFVFRITLQGQVYLLFIILNVYSIMMQMRCCEELKVTHDTSIIETAQYFTLFRHRNHAIPMQCLLLNTERIT